MDMSVKAGGNATTIEQPKNKPSTDRRNSSDLDLWLEKAEAMGELKRITAEVSPDLEAAHITYLVGLEKSPALLFENIKGHPGHKALYNMIGCNLSRFCLMIGEEPVDHPLKAVQLLQKKLGRKMAPVEVPAESAICNQNIVEGDKIDIRMFPAQRMWPLDGGMYLGTADSVITKDPDTGRVNVGTYRMMIKGPREIGVYTSPGKDAGTDRDKWWKMGKPTPIAAAYGIDPLLFLVGAIEPAEDRKRVRILFRHQGLADRAVHLRPHRPAAAGARRDHHRRPSLSGRDLRRRPVRRVHRLLRTAERRHALHARRAPALPQQSDADLRADGRRAVERVRAVLGGGALRRHLGRSAKARRAGHPGRVVDPRGRRLGHDRRLDQADVRRPRAAGDGARRAMHRRRLFRQIRHRGRRRHRPEQRRPGAVGDGDAVAAGAVDRHPARDLEHVPRSEPEPAGDQAVGFEGLDQRLHGLQAHQVVLAAHQARQEDVRQRGVALDRARASPARRR